MNANELADEVESWSKIWDCNIINVTKFSKEAATMLRQQQAEIERLTMLCDCMTTESNRKGNEIEALKKSHIELERGIVKDLNQRQKNELADKLQELDSKLHLIELFKSATMLRQQQSEIEVLTKFLDETCQIGKFIVWNSTDKAQEK